MRDRIEEYLENTTKAVDIITINDALNLESVEDLENLQTCINELIKEGIVHETKKQKYILMKYCKSLKTGKVNIAKNGYGFLIQDNDEEDIFIGRDNLNGAINDDIVLVDIFTRNNKIEGKVIKILERKLTRVIGTIKYIDNKLNIILDDKKLDIDIKLVNHFNNLVDGHKVLVELTKQISEKRFIGTIIKIIGQISVGFMFSNSAVLTFLELYFPPVIFISLNLSNYLVEPYLLEVHILEQDSKY